MADEKKADKAKKVKRPTPQKRDIQGERRRIRNKSFRARVMTSIRSLEQAAAANDANAVKVKFNAVYSLLDKGVKTGIYQQNKASRIKSRLALKSSTSFQKSSE